MPGILPMKVIKVGNTSQSRIAQACDRCRSKKIRCDGIRPCCTQCANVGFECKTSDKLSRRAFPRGYTESLEDRVRSLEGEVRELKELLDEKDEKIDLLSRIHSFGSPTSRKSSTILSPTASEDLKGSTHASRDDTFHVEQGQEAADQENTSGDILGASSVPAFVDSFKRKVQETSKPCSDIDISTLFARVPQSPSKSTSSPTTRTLPRIVTDQLINIFFQEWAPLFPVLHRPTMLRLYEDFCADSGSIQNDRQAIAQLNLVFAIASFSSPLRAKQDPVPLERQWQTALSSVLCDVSISTLQCLVLAQIYCLTKGDHSNLLRYKGIAIGLCHQLGLHQSQRRRTQNALSRETRKRVFWCQYVLDRFSSAVLGVPVLLQESDIQCEYPADVDDENVTEKGFLPTLPGESTRLSSALALFHLSRILTKVLEQNYPSSLSYDLSFTNIHNLADELDTWLNNLPPHLRLQFVQDKPSTNVISSRSPLLSFGYYYIRILVHRPLVALSSDSRASASLLALADSSKHIIQILELLDERHMSFSFCMNRIELLLLAGFGLLYQCLGLRRESKLIKDSQKLIRTVVDMLQAEEAAGAQQFKKVAISLVSEGSPKASPSPRKSIENSMSPPDSTKQSTRKQLQAIASRFSFSSHKPTRTEEASRRATVPRVTPGAVGGPPGPGLALYGRNPSQISISSARSEPAGPRQSPPKAGSINLPIETLNLDYFPLGNEPVSSFQRMGKNMLGTADWERILSNMDNGNANIYDGIYGGPSPDAEAEAEALSAFVELYPAAGSGQEWAPDTWPVSVADRLPKVPVPQSVLSFSDESLTSGEDLSSSGCHDCGPDSFKGILMPQLSDDFELEGLPGSWEF